MNLNLAFARTLAFVPALQRLSPRERLLIGSLGAIALVLIPLKAYDWQQTASAQAQEAQVDLEGARQAARSGAMFTVNRRVATQRKEIRGWAWSAPTRPIGRVLLESQISTLALQAGMTNVDVKSLDAVETVGGLDFIHVDVGAAFDWLTLSKFLNSVAATGKGVIVDSISAPSEAPPKVQIVLRLPLAVTQSPAPDTSAKPRSVS